MLYYPIVMKTRGCEFPEVAGSIKCAFEASRLGPTRITLFQSGESDVRYLLMKIHSIGNLLRF